MQIIDLKDFKLAIDPDTNFWTIYDEEIPETVMNLYKNVNDKLRDDLLKYRFETKFSTVYLNVTEKCNADCPYCYIPKEVRKRGRTMDYDNLESILNNLKEMGIEWVIFHGAEPLIAKELIFKAIENFDFNFGIQTNGFLLDEDDAEFIRERGVNFGISFDSPYRQTNDFLRGKGHFDKVSKIIEWFEGYDRINVITTITKHNYLHLKDMVDFLVEKVETVLMNPVRGTNKVARNLRAEPERAADMFIKAVERAIQYAKNGKRIVIGDFANIILGIIAPTSRVLQCDVSPCGAGRRFFAVSVDGIFPCGEFIGFEEFKVGLDKIKDLINEFHSVRDRIVEKIDDCRDCPYRNICGSPCPAEVYAEFGSMFKKSPNCEFYKRIIEHAFRVIARGDTEYVIRVENLREVYRILEVT